MQFVGRVSSVTSAHDKPLTLTTMMFFLNYGLTAILASEGSHPLKHA